MKNAVITVPAYFNDSQRQVGRLSKSFACLSSVSLRLVISIMLKYVEYASLLTINDIDIHSLPSELRCIAVDSTFRRRLKAELFSRAYDVSIINI